MFSEKDLQQIKSKGIDIETINEQINKFKTGFPYINLQAAATKQNAIKVLSASEEEKYLNSYNELIREREIIKFVPASGAASRMFKLLFEFAESYTPDAKGEASFLKDKGFNSVHYFIQHIKDFAFYKDLAAIMEQDGLHITEEIQKKNYHIVIEYLLNEKSLGYAQLPKGLLKFHSYDDENRLAIEEHLVEAAVYCKSDDNIAKLHFTVSAEHQNKFETAVKKFKAKYEEEYQTSFDITFSQQKPSTDTIAVDTDNQPFREEDGSLLFRPGGHGALIENLNDIDADIIFIKNIDNIVPDHLKGITFKYKKLIGSYLIRTQEQLHSYLEILEEGNPEKENLEKMFGFLEKDLFIKVPTYIRALDTMEQIDWLFEQMNRPVRVCGMVKNEGEPGGGPFIVKDEDASLSLQIVESSQIDLNNSEQQAIVKQATHFNPVDLVCAVRDYNDEKFDLKEFVDPNTGFISEKSKNGKVLKAQELPGLWNGAMAKWITIFMEVPIDTFNPVKTVNDLLRDSHQ